MKFDLQRFVEDPPMDTLGPVPSSSTKSYTLADNTTVTVNTTANGVEFNEGMGALTKAIKAKINASSGGGASKQIATLTCPTIGDEVVSPNSNHTFTYNGDGVLKTTVGTMSGTTLSVSSSDANKSGVVYAQETNNYSAVVFPFTVNPTSMDPT